MDMRSVIRVNLKDGKEDGTTALLAGITAVNGDPSAVTDGVDTRGAGWVMLSANSASGTSTLKLWEYDPASAAWIQNTDLGSWAFASGQKRRARVRIAGASRVYVELDAVSGATVTCHAVGLFGVDG